MESTGFGVEKQEKKKRRFYGAASAFSGVCVVEGIVMLQALRKQLRLGL